MRFCEVEPSYPDSVIFTVINGVSLGYNSVGGRPLSMINHHSSPTTSSFFISSHAAKKKCHSFFNEIILLLMIQSDGILFEYQHQ